MPQDVLKPDQQQPTRGAVRVDDDARHGDEIVAEQERTGTDQSDSSNAICVIGAGPSGLAVIKNLQQAGFAVQAFEAEDDVGGNWYFGTAASSVYESTHLISSKKLIEFADYPMPDAYPHYPSHEQALEYLRNYARHFDLCPRIQFKTRVERIEKIVLDQKITADKNKVVPDKNNTALWRVQLSDGTTRRFRGVVIANGHHCVPNAPELPGKFDGTILHSHDYKSASQLRDQRVLVVGAGNSGCDIAVDASTVAKSVAISMRRGYHFVPKFLRGMPSDELGEALLRWRVPLWLRRLLLRFGIRVATGDPTRYGLEAPDHKFLETHPLINSQLLYAIGHGEVIPMRGIANCNGNTVTFTDGKSADFDTIVLATGYKITFPFIAPELLNTRDGIPRLYLHAFHPTEDRLFVAGMIQVDSGQWGITDVQAQLIARFLVAQETDPAQAEWFRQLKSGPQPDLGNGVRYDASPRHAIEVEHFSYRKRLEKLVKKFGDASLTMKK